MFFLQMTFIWVYTEWLRGRRSRVLSKSVKPIKNTWSGGDWTSQTNVYIHLRWTMIFFHIICMDLFLVKANHFLWNVKYIKIGLPGGGVDTVVMMNFIFTFVRRATRVRKRSTVRSQRNKPRTVLFSFSSWDLKRVNSKTTLINRFHEFNL